ncbi:hypothetical protein [Campylobacter sp. RM16190]|uniref:hypothetical protein n=1 Tax=Campylobacter sp. RM16190 TaxID=1705727 RepID=UPI00147626D9|nr:hypothetical protein [Campylobacter sp. RM16190]
MKSILEIIKIAEIPKPIVIICFLMAIVSSFFAVILAQFFGFAISAISNGANNGLIYDLITNHKFRAKQL